MIDLSPIIAFIVLQFVHRVTILMLLKAGGLY